jgi:hypothetical protein
VQVARAGRYDGHGGLALLAEDGGVDAGADMAVGSKPDMRQLFAEIVHNDRPQIRIGCAKMHNLTLSLQ